MYKNTNNLIYALLLTIAAMIMGQGRACASSTFSVTNVDNGNGTEGSPYIISSTSDLNWLASQVNSGTTFEGYFFELGNNITYTESDGGNNYTAIGTEDHPFCGNFDGKGYVIGGININQPEQSYQGLFGYVSGGTVKNVILDGAVISANNHVGGIVGYCYGGTISDCFVYKTTVTCNSTRHGAIVDNNSATLTGNYYRDCNVNGATINVGTFNGDIDGAAEAVYTITPATNISASGASVTYQSVPYFAKNAEVSLSYSGDITAGYNAIWYIVTSSGSGSTDVSGYGLVDGYTFLMPPVNLSASVDNTKLALALLDDDSARPAGKKNANYIAVEGTKNVELHGRTLYKDGEWNTICLPFSLASLTGTPLEGATLMELDVTGTYDTDKKTGFDDSDGTLYLYFKPATSITAGTPYIIKWGSPEGKEGYLGTAIDSPRFTGVTINKEDPTTVQSADETLSFKGTYTYLPFAAKDQTILFMGEENTLYYPLSGARIGAFRSYFELTDPSIPVKSFVLSFGEDETGIINYPLSIINSSGAGVWYTLDGRKVANGQKPTAKGLYINNGRKIVIK